MNAYEQKKEARIARLEARAVKAGNESTQRHDQARHIAELTNGQPILVGHHSERGHRAALGRMNNHLKKASEAYDKSEEYKRRAVAAKNNHAISSDDPDAAEKLRARIADLVKISDTMKAANKIVRGAPKNQRTEEKLNALEALGLERTRAASLFNPDFCGRLGFPQFEVNLNSANRRRLAKRLDDIEARAEQETSETTHGTITVLDNVEENRVQLLFPGKPDAETRREMKQNGFKWAPSQGAWQRKRSTWALASARRLADKFGGSNE